jgi:hypothetical protein
MDRHEALADFLNELELVAVGALHSGCETLLELGDQHFRRGF